MSRRTVPPAAVPHAPRSGGWRRLAALMRKEGYQILRDPSSIGKANSLGCVRMADEDIDLVFSLLYDVHSRVDVVP